MEKPLHPPNLDVTIAGIMRETFTSSDHQMNEQHPIKRKTTPCPGCGGSGQTSYFAGESRFMLTWEDCPDCCGTGVLLDSGNDASGIIFSGGRSSRDEPLE